MQRDIKQLTESVFDLIVVGGGIYGLFTAWDAALRGLSAALIERADFGCATSSNSLRVIHGGLRYLQQGDIRRMRVSIEERTNYLRIAPHLVHPLPFLIPTYGHGMKGREIMSVALKLHDLVGLDRNQLPDHQKHLPPSRILSREECLIMYPGIQEEGLSGAALLYDAQMSNSERLVAGVMRSAIQAGAHLANYVEATGPLMDNGQLRGIRAMDHLTGSELDIKGRMLVNAAGPWANQLGKVMCGQSTMPRLVLSKAFNLLINRPLASGSALGVYSKSQYNARDSSGSRGSRIFFILPWGGQSLIGTEHLLYSGEPDSFHVTENEIGRFIEDINAAYPSADLAMEDVAAVYAGMLPADESVGEKVNLTKHYRIHDHAKEGGPQEFLSIMGVKFTEARHVAEKTVDLVFRKLGKSEPHCITSITPIYGGKIDDFEAFLHQHMGSRPMGLGAEGIKRLILRYGSAYPEVLQYLSCQQNTDTPEDEAIRILRAEVLHSIRHEMAQKLSDVVLRRTSAKQEMGYGTLRNEYLSICASTMSEELEWGIARVRAEIEEVAGVEAR